MIEAIELVNAGPFRGEHRVELLPRAYAVTARYESDAGRSNWGGKSFLIETINFALHGKWKKSRRYDADGWLTHGETEGRVALYLEGGWTVERTKRRGKPLQIRFVGPDGKAAAQADAQAEIQKLLRFTPEDFVNAAYFESKQMARLIHTEPEKRLDIVRGWLGIEAAERAEEEADREVKSHVREIQKLRERKKTLEALLAELPVPADEKRYTKMRDELVEKIAAAEKKVQEQRDASREYGIARGIVDEHEALVEKGKKLAAEVENLAVNAKEARDATRKRAQDALAEERLAAEALKTKKKVALGLFDGKCPVAEIECPATKRINADREAAQEAREKAEKAFSTAQAKTRLAFQAETDAREKYEAGERKKETLARMRAEAQEVAETVKKAKRVVKAGPPEIDTDAEDSLHGLRQQHTEACIVLARQAEAWDRRVKYEWEIGEVTKTLEALTRQAAIRTRGRAIFRSTQRRVAERGLGAIGANATALLASAAIDLSVRFSWEYEGKDLANACDDCGAAFPKSAKVKQCESCGAERGRNVIRRLDVERSRESDGADDLCGVALQLSAGSWLLSARESPWSTAILDEPLAACDKTNRRAAAGSLVRLLGSGTWRQAMVISHSSDTVDAFPGRIEVIIEEDGSRRIVTS